MSTASPPAETEESYECGHCGDDRYPSTSVAGAFCSTACHRSHQRAKQAGDVFETIEHDHRFCRTCFAQLKEVSKPGRSLVIPPSLHDEDWGNASDVLIGYQYRTEHAETGEISLDVDDEADRPIVEDGVATGTVCYCGNTSHQHSEPAIRETLSETILVVQLVAALETLRADDKHDIGYDTAILEAALEDTGDIHDALTRAICLE